MQMYAIKHSQETTHRKKTSFSTLLSTGRQKQIKERILICLAEQPMTARQLSEKIECMRSSVCFALKKHTANNLITDKDSIFDNLTERTVTLYSLQNSEHLKVP